MSSHRFVSVVPWYAWTELKVVFEAILSHSPKQWQLAIGRINAWKLRQKVPIAIDATGSILEAMLNDRFFNEECDFIRTEYELRLQASMIITRFVNELVEHEQIGRYARSVRSIAMNLQLPLLLVDIRHNATHAELPSLLVLRNGLTQSLLYAKEKFWIPQIQLIDKVLEDSNFEVQLLERLSALALKFKSYCCPKILWNRCMLKEAKSLCLLHSEALLQKLQFNKFPSLKHLYPSLRHQYSSKSSERHAPTRTSPLVQLAKSKKSKWPLKLKKSKLLFLKQLLVCNIRQRKLKQNNSKNIFVSPKLSFPPQNMAKRWLLKCWDIPYLLRITSKILPLDINETRLLSFVVECLMASFDPQAHPLVGLLLLYIISTTSSNFAVEVVGQIVSLLFDLPDVLQNPSMEASDDIRIQTNKKLYSYTYNAFQRINLWRRCCMSPKIDGSEDPQYLSYTICITVCNRLCEWLRYLLLPKESSNSFASFHNFNGILSELFDPTLPFDTTAILATSVKLGKQRLRRALDIFGEDMEILVFHRMLYLKEQQNTIPLCCPVKDNSTEPSFPYKADAWPNTVSLVAIVQLMLDLEIRVQQFEWLKRCIHAFLENAPIPALPTIPNCRYTFREEDTVVAPSSRVISCVKADQRKWLSPGTEWNGKQWKLEAPIVAIASNSPLSKGHRLHESLSKLLEKQTVLTNSKQKKRKQFEKQKLLLTNSGTVYENKSKGELEKDLIADIPIPFSNFFKLSNEAENLRNEHLSTFSESSKEIDTFSSNPIINAFHNESLNFLSNA